MALLNQISSLCYWFQTNTALVSTLKLDSDSDSYYIGIKKGETTLYSHKIESFSKKTAKIISFELATIVKNLINIKEHYSTES